jgi:gluconate 5-dehydrogenase
MSPHPPIGPATFRLDGRLALVTGSTGGIGLALARGLAEAGAAVVVNGRTGERVAAAARALREEGHTVHESAFDATDATAVEAAVAALEAGTGPLDILINNAGITRRAPFHQLAHDDWHAVMDTNVNALFAVGQAAARRMVGRRRGAIVNICSLMSDFGRAGTAAYTTSKGAAKMLTKAMAIDLAPHGVRVNGIAPGYFGTELTAPLKADAGFDGWVRQRTPLGRWGEVDELAPVAVFLCSDAARYVTGHLLFVDGGMSAAL